MDNLINIFGTPGSADFSDRLVPGREFTSMEEIRQFEEKYGITLPKNYAGFLLKYGGRTTGDYCLYTSHEPNPDVSEWEYNEVSYFLGNDIVNNVDVVQEEFEGKLFPIAHSTFGDYVCIGLRDEYLGKIYLWVHDEEWRDELRKRVYLVANSLEEFIASFEKDDS
jgi:cell wall assembly regulator SMI1